MKPQADGLGPSRRRRWWGWGAGIVGVLLVVVPLLVQVCRRQMILDRLQRSKEACRRADDNLLLAMSAFGDRVDHLGLDSRLLAQEELAFYKAIYDEAVSEPAERFAVATARRRAGLLQLELHQPEEARLSLTIAIHMLEALAVEPLDPEYLRKYRCALAESYAEYATYQAAIGNIPGAEEQYGSALTLIEKLIADRPDCDDFLAAQSRFWESRGEMYARLHRYNEAEADLRRTLPTRMNRIYGESLYRVWLRSPACELVETRLQLSGLYRDTKRPSDSIEALTEAQTTLANYPRYDRDLHYRRQHAEVLEKLAEAYADAGKQTESADAFHKALLAYRQLEQDYPEVAAFRQRHDELGARLGSNTAAGERRQ